MGLLLGFAGVSAVVVVVGVVVVVVVVVIGLVVFARISWRRAVGICWGQRGRRR